MGRIDWRHYAKTGEFVTQQYRDDRSGTTAILVDARAPTRRANRPAQPTGAEYAATVAEQLLRGLERGTAAPTIGAVGLDRALPEELVDATGLSWLEPGDEQRPERTGLLFDAVTAVVWADATDDPPTAAPSMRADADVAHANGSEAGLVGDGGWSPGPQSAPADWTVGDTGLDVRTIAVRMTDRLSPRSEVVLCSPLLDRWPVELAETLQDREHSVTLVSPDVTDGDGLGARVAALERRDRIDRLRGVGVGVVDWQPASGIGTALQRTQRVMRGSR